LCVFAPPLKIASVLLMSHRYRPDPRAVFSRERFYMHSRAYSGRRDRGHPTTRCRTSAIYDSQVISVGTSANTGPCVGRSNRAERHQAPALVADRGERIDAVRSFG
jgi:hypothetical protein